MWAPHVRIFLNLERRGGFFNLERRGSSSTFVVRRGGEGVGNGVVGVVGGGGGEAVGQQRGGGGGCSVAAL